MEGGNGSQWATVNLGVFFNAKVRLLYDSTALSHPLMSSQPAPSPLHPGAFKHLVTDELQGSDFQTFRRLHPSFVSSHQQVGSSWSKVAPASCQSCDLRHLPHDCDECWWETVQLYDVLTRCINLFEILHGSFVFADLYYLIFFNPPKKCPFVDHWCTLHLQNRLSGQNTHLSGGLFLQRDSVKDFAKGSFPKHLALSPTQAKMWKNHNLDMDFFSYNQEIALDRNLFYLMVKEKSTGVYFFVPASV